MWQTRHVDAACGILLPTLDELEDKVAVTVAHMTPHMGKLFVPRGQHTNITPHHICIEQAKSRRCHVFAGQSRLKNWIGNTWHSKEDVLQAIMMKVLRAPGFEEGVDNLDNS